MPRLILHENITSKDEVKSGSNKSFGLVFSVVFMIIGLWPILNEQPVRIWALVVAAILVVVSFAAPRILAPLNRIWFLFGLLLHKIISPIVMALLFFTTVTPIALIMRVLGKLPLPLNFDPDAKSYWIERDPPGPEPETMTRQF